MHYLFQFVYDICHGLRRHKTSFPAIEEQSIYACVHRPHDVVLIVVANHDGAFGICPCHFQRSIVKSLRRLQCADLIAEYDGIKLGVQTTGIELLVLHFTESVTANMQAVALAFQVVHQLARPFDDARLFRAEFKKAVADVVTILF